MARIRTHSKSLGLSGAPLRRLLLGFAIGIALIALTWGARRIVSTDDAPQANTPPSTVSQVETPSSPEVAGETPDAPKVAKPAGLSALSGDTEIPTPGEVLLTLCIVVGVMVVLLVIVGKLMRRARLAPGKERTLKLADALSLGAKRQVFAVDYKGRTLILGCGGEEVSLLAEYAQDEFPTETDEPDLAPETSEIPAGPDDEETGVCIDLSPSARRAARTPDSAESPAAGDATRNLPVGAHRVPKAFRHLLEKNLQEGNDQ